MNQTTTWRLQDIYSSSDCVELQQDREFLRSCVILFQKKYFQKLSVENLLDSIKDYDNILRLFSKIGSYAFLNLQTKLDNETATSFFQSTSEWLCELESKLVFFTIEISNLDEKKAKIVSKEYESFIDSCFKYKKHLLGQNAEEALSQKSITSNLSWIRFYDETLTRLVFDYRGEQKTLPEIVEIANHNQDDVVRAEASAVFAKRLEQESFYIKHIYNNIILDRSIETRLRSYDFCDSSRHLSNNIDSQTVEFLIDSVSAKYFDISHRYYKLKAKLLKKEKLEYWDRNVSVKFSSIFDKKYDYEKSCEIVLEAFGSFSKIFEDIARNFIQKGWIDVFPSKSKTSGAFSHSCSCDVHPFILLNHFGNIRDVSTLAHELGHGVHQTLSAKNGTILSDTPITISEVASLFAEKILFEKMFDNAENRLEKIDLLCSKIDDSINSVIRQVAFFKFEKAAHELRQKRELNVSDLNQLFLETQRECLGNEVNVAEFIGYYWSYISHFFHAPFYVYAYAFGELFTNTLYEQYKTSAYPAEFIKKYIEMLSLGGVEKYDIIASKFGLDPKDKKFWYKGLSIIESQINELESLCDPAIFD